MTDTPKTAVAIRAEEYAWTTRDLCPQQTTIKLIKHGRQDFIDNDLQTLLEDARMMKSSCEFEQTIEDLLEQARKL